MWRNSKRDFFFLLGPLHSSVSSCAKKCQPWPFFLPVRLRKMNVCSPLLVNISVYGGHEVEGFRERAPLASALIERWYMSPGVQRINIKQRGVQGTLFLPPGAPKSPPPPPASFKCLSWRQHDLWDKESSCLWAMDDMNPFCCPNRSRTLPWAIGHVGWWRGANRVSFGFASVPRLCFFGAGVSQPWRPAVRWNGVQLFWGLYETTDVSMWYDVRPSRSCRVSYPASSGGSTSNPFFGFVFV